MPEAPRPWRVTRGRTAGRTGLLRRPVAALVTVAAALGLAACSDEPDTPEVTSTVIVAMGDSYSVGYRPVGGSTATMTSSDESFPNDLAGLLTTDRKDVSVENFGCAGATSEDLTDTRGCDEGRLAPDGPRYTDVTQADAAEAYLQANQGRIEAVTLVIGGNDISSCIAITDTGVTGDPSGCIYERLVALRDRLDALLPRLRAAAGPDVPIVGLTYPDVYLGLWLSGTGGQELARQSLELFRDQLNPMLRERYAAVGARFVDLTDEFGGDVPLTQTRETQWGNVPEAVAQVCELTYACSASDTHPTPEGHAKIAELVRDALEGPALTPTTSTTAPASPTS